MIETPRLLLRAWRESDREPFWAMAQDAEAVRFLPPWTRAGSDAAIDRMMAMEAEHGHCFWVAERRADGRMVGSCGLLVPRAPTFELEIGWRFERAVWGHGYAREAGQASLEFAWGRLAARTVVGVVSPGNARSWGLMQRLGMTRDPGEDFDDPDLAEDDPLRRCQVYRIARPR
jgi:RimJ/RimL family protein N-acetyltransferase